jgi:hypothetical protein
MNAHILLELEGVEVGSKECGGCRHIQERSYVRFCRPFGWHLESSQNSGPDGLTVSSLRCPECLEAEKRAMEKGKVTCVQRQRIIEAIEDDVLMYTDWAKKADDILYILGLEAEKED